MKYLPLLFLFSMLFFSACDNEEQAVPEQGIAFIGGPLNFDNAFLSRDQTVPDGTFQTRVTLLENPATQTLIDGITGLPADAFQFTINSGTTPLELPDGTYSFGNPNAPFQFSGILIKNNLTMSFEDTYDVRSGSITVSTNSDGSKLLAFDLQTVAFLDFFNPDASVVTLRGETTVNTVVVE